MMLWRRVLAWPCSPCLHVCMGVLCRQHAHLYGKVLAWMTCRPARLCNILRCRLETASDYTANTSHTLKSLHII